MTNKINSPDPPDPMEELWQESELADQAGVFRRSPVAADRLLDQSEGRVSAGSAHRRARWLGVAAALAIAGGSWTFLFRSELASLHDRPGFASTLPISAGARLAVRLGDCLQGPGTDGSFGPCADQDLDADGDVDLRDLSRQLAVASRTP